MTASEHKVHTHPDGKTFLCIDSRNIETQLSHLKTGEFFGVMIGRIHGYSLDDVEFLRTIPEIQGVHIQDEIADITAIRALTKLEYLLVADPSDIVDVSKFPSLRELRVVGWNSNVTKIDECSNLEVLYVNRFSPKTGGLSLIAPKSGLQELEIVQSTLTSLNGLEDLEQLSSLTLRHCTKLEDVSDIKCLSTCLRKLILDRCKRIADFSAIGQLDGLLNLSINACGNLESIDFVSALKTLETIGLIGGTNVVDGDLSPLLSLPVLRFAGTDKKKHYSHTPSELERLLENRSQ